MTAPALAARGRSSKPSSTRRSRSRLLAALAATLAGWISVSAGLGMGLPRTAGDIADATMTVLALIFGVGMLALAATELARVARGWSRLILVPWVLALLVGVYSLSIALAAAYPPHPMSNASPPAGATRIDMITDDGVRLYGWYLPSTNGAALVLRHGAGSTSADVMAHARVLNDAGYGVLATDARGHGRSGGQGMDLGWYGESDIRAAVDALADRVEVDARRIGIVGLSMGGEEAIGAAAADRRVRAVVAEGATGRTAADKAWLADEYGMLGVVQGGLDAVTYGFIDLLTSAQRPPSLASAVHDSSSTAFLLVAAGRVPDERFVALRLATIDASRVQVWVVPDAGHVQALHIAPSDWQTRVIGFLNDTLARGSASSPTSYGTT